MNTLARAPPKRASRDAASRTASPLHIQIQQQIPALLQTPPHIRPPRPIIPPMHQRIFQKLSLGHFRIKRRPVQKMIIHPVNLPLSRHASGARDHAPDALRKRRRQALAQRRFSTARRSRNHQQQCPWLKTKTHVTLLLREPRTPRPSSQSPRRQFPPPRNATAHGSPAPTPPNP